MKGVGHAICCTESVNELNHKFIDFFLCAFSAFIGYIIIMTNMHMTIVFDSLCLKLQVILIFMLRFINEKKKC